MYTFVACQSFAGGFDLGMVQAGFELIHKVEMEGGFGMANCLANRHLLGERWTHQACAYQDWEVMTTDVIAANPPCSGFSLMTDRKHRGVDSKINACMWALMEYAAKVKPTVLVMESVRQAYSVGASLMTALREQLECDSGLRYDAYHVYQDAIDLGGAARRPRYFLVLSRVPFGVDYPDISRKPLLRDIWDDLRGHPITWESQPYRRPATWWTSKPRSNCMTFDGHFARFGSPVRRALDLMDQAAEDGGWPIGWDVSQMVKYCYERYGQLPESWQHMTEKIVKRNFHMGYASMRRWDPNKVGRVIMGSALDLVLHPWEPRTITHREAARVMGFPDDWRIKPLRVNSNLRSTWGKGISTQCGRWIGEQVRNALDGYVGSITGVSVGEREWFIEKPRVGARRDSPATVSRSLDYELILT